MEMPEKVKKLVPGEEFVLNLVDENGFNKISPWGLTIPPLKIYCEKFHDGKRLGWDYSFFGDFIYESCANGVSTERFDNWLFEETGLRGFCVKFLMSNKEKFAELNKKRLEYHKNAVIMIQDLDNSPKRYDQIDLKMMETKHKSRLGVLSRLDPEFREKIEQKVEGNIAQIILPPKDSDDNYEENEESEIG